MLAPAQSTYRKRSDTIRNSIRPMCMHVILDDDVRARDRSGRSVTATSSTRSSRSTAPRARRAPSHNRATAESSSDKKNQSVSGISATAVSRCAHQWTVPSLAEPAAEHASEGTAQTHSRPPCHSNAQAPSVAQTARRARRTNRSRGAGVRSKPEPHVPAQMAHAVEQVKQKGEGPAGQTARDRPGSRTARSASGSCPRRPRASSARKVSARKP